MKTIINNNMKKFILSCAVLSILLLGILIYLSVGRNIEIKTFQNDIFSMQYDSTWRREVSENDFILLRNENSTLEISIMTLEEEQRYFNISQLIGEIEFTINNQNYNFSQIARQRTNVTRSNLIGYQFLYEEDGNQAMVTVTKASDRLIIFTYIAEDQVFDILLNSVGHIIANFELNRPSFALEAEIDELELVNIVWQGELAVTNTREYLLASNLFKVRYTLPEKFLLSNFNNNLKQFSFRSESFHEIRIVANIKHNLFEWTHMEGFGTLQSEYQRLLNQENNQNVQLESSRNTNFEGGYIHRISFTRERSFTEGTDNHEVVYMVFPLNHRRFFSIEINATNIPLSNDIINNIGIVSIDNIASYISRDIQDGILINEMKSMFGMEREYYQVNLRLNEAWQERDHTFNVYETRRFGLNCERSLTSVCEYNLSYELRTPSIVPSNAEDIRRVLDLVRGDREANLQATGSFIHNGIEYQRFTSVFNRNIDGESKRFYETILYLELEHGYFVVILDRQGSSITNDMLNEVLNFTITNETFN